MKDLEKIFKAFANRRRLAILKYLKNKKEASVADVSENINLSFKATSKHLNILAAIDVIEKDQRSLQVFYSLSAAPKPVIQRLISIL